MRRGEGIVLGNSLKVPPPQPSPAAQGREHVSGFPRYE